MAKSSFIVYLFVASNWRNPTSQLLFLLAKVAKAAAVVVNDGGTTSSAKYGGNDEVMARLRTSQNGWVSRPSGRGFGVQGPKFPGVDCQAARSGPYLASLTRVHFWGHLLIGEIPFINTFFCRHW